MYEKYSEGGKELWRFDYGKRSKINPRIKIRRKRKGIVCKNETAAQKYHQSLVEEVMLEIGRLESQGLNWEDLVGKWDQHFTLRPTRQWSAETRDDHYARLRNYTKRMSKIFIKDLQPGDVEDVLAIAKAGGASDKLLKSIRHSIDVVYRWGMKMRYIQGKESSICQHVYVDESRSVGEKLPLILTKVETEKFLNAARVAEHPWYPIWYFAIYTGMRSGEVNALRKQNIELVSPDEAKRLDAAPSHEKKNYGKITVALSWNKKAKKNGPTKSRWWRTVPVNSKLYYFLSDQLKGDFGSDEDGARVFERFRAWDSSRAASVLREFCKSQGLKEIKFHTLRACFATHLAAAGVNRETIKKIGGWREGKTLDIYIRAAGIDEAGGTEVLDFKDRGNREDQFVESGQNVVNLFGK